MQSQTSRQFLQDYPVDFIIYHRNPSKIVVINPYFPNIFSCISHEFLRYQSEALQVLPSATDSIPSVINGWYRSVIDNIYEPTLSQGTGKLSFIMKGLQYNYSSGSGFSYVSLHLPPLWSFVRDQESLSSPRLGGRKADLSMPGNEAQGCLLPNRRTPARHQYNTIIRRR